jgi:hypothetical protein
MMRHCETSFGQQYSERKNEFMMNEHDTTRVAHEKRYLDFAMTKEFIDDRLTLKGVQ